MRIEKKYSFRKCDLSEIIQDLKIISSNVNKYKVTSIYFDNANEASYLQKVNGDKNKIKVRARYYNDSLEFINLEAKIKFSDKSYKLKTRLTESELNSLLNQNFLNVGNGDSDKAKIYYYLKYFGMQKKLNIDYERIEMSLKTQNKIRLTIDYDVFSALNIGTKVNQRRCVNEDLCILEIKADNNFIEKYVKFILEKYKMNYQAISKCALGDQTQKLSMSRL